MKKRQPPVSPVDNSVYVWFKYNQNDPELKHLWSLYKPLIGDHHVLVLQRKKNIMIEVERIKKKRDDQKERMKRAYDKRIDDVLNYEPPTKKTKIKIQKEPPPAKAPKDFKWSGVNKTKPIPQSVIDLNLEKIKKLRNDRQIEILRKEIEVFEKYLKITKSKKGKEEIRDNIRQLQNKIDQLLDKDPKYTYKRNLRKS